MESYCLKWACSPRLFGVVISLFFFFQSSYLLNGWARNSGDRPEAGWAGSWAQSTLMSIFSFQVREFFVLHRMVGRTWRGVLTPGYFQLCSFPSQLSAG